MEQSLTKKQLTWRQKHIDRFYSNKEFTDNKELINMVFDEVWYYKVKCKHCGMTYITSYSRIMMCPKDSPCTKKKLSNSQIERYKDPIQREKTRQQLTSIPFTEERKHNISQGLLNHYKNESPESKSKRIERSKSYWNSQPQEYKDNFSNLVRTGLSTMTPQSKQQHQQRLSQSRKEYLSTIDTNKMYQNSLGNYYKNLTNEQRTHLREAKQITWNNHSQEDKLRISTNARNKRLEYLYKDHPNIYLIRNKDYLESIIDSFSTKPTLYDLESKLGMSWQNFIARLEEFELLDKLMYSKRHDSIFQQEVQQFIKSLNIPYQHNVHSVLSNKRLELDIYIPSHNLAIECNGLYYHYYPVKDKDYHYNKSRLCEERGIRLIHIWENEWYNERQQPILKSIIKNALGLTSTKVYARNTYCSVEPSASLKDFVNQNNIAGFRGGKFAITLRDKHTNELLMCYIIGNAYFGKGKYQYEVIRGATKLDTTVIGGASKIWHYFIDNYEPQSCVYYIDYNYFNGNSLPNLGLQFITSQPGFKNWFILTNEVLNRDPQHHKEISELVKRGLVREIYTAGTKVYLYTKEKHND